MRIISNDEAGTLTLCPTNSEEEQVVNSIIQTLKLGDIFAYRGRGRYEEYSYDDDRFCTVNLAFGGSREKRRKIFKSHFPPLWANISTAERAKALATGKYTVELTERSGDIEEFVLKGTTDEDKYVVNNIRNCCFFGSVGKHCSPIYLSQTEVDGETAVIIALDKCKHCERTVIDYTSCLESVCTPCALVCEHEYEEAAESYCEKCGRLKSFNEKIEKLDEIGKIIDELAPC